MPLPPGVTVRPNVISTAMLAAAQAGAKLAGGFSSDRVLSYVEALRYAGIPVPKGARIGVRPLDVVMQAALTSAAPQQNSDVFRVPAGEVAIIRRIRSFVRLQSLSTEASDVGNFTIANANRMTETEWKRLKSGNCAVTLTRTDTSQVPMLGVALDSMFAELGAEPINVERNAPGWIELPGAGLQAGFELSDTSAAAAGAATLYGIVLEMSLISVLGAGTADPTDTLSAAVARRAGQLHPVYADAILRAGVKLRRGQFVSVRPVIAPVLFELTLANSRNQSTFIVPRNTVALVREFRPFATTNSITTEAATIGNFVAMTPTRWKVLKSNNAFMQIVVKNQDRDILRGDFPLSAASPDIGGEALRFDDSAAAFVAAPNDTIQVAAALDDTALVGANTRYGATVVMTLLETLG